MNDIISNSAFSGDLSLDMGKKLQALQEQVQTLELCRQLGNHYAHTDMVPKQYQGKPESAAVAIQWGIEIGLQPLQALQNIAVISGVPALWGDALIAIIKGSGCCEYIRSEFDDTTMTAHVATKRKGEPEEVRSFSLDDAKKAGLLNRQTYQQHPKRMLNARARSHVLRDVYADLLRGFQVREIVEEDHPIEKDITPKTSSDTLKALVSKPGEQPAKAKSAQQAEPATPEPAGNPEAMTLMLNIIDTANDMAQLNQIAEQIKSDREMNQAEKQQIRAAWKTRKGEIEAEA